MYPSIKEASKVAGISPVTASRYLNSPSLRKKINEYQEQITEENIKGLQNLLGKTNRTLSKILDTGTTNQKIQVCKIILDNAYKGMETLEIKQRLDVLEEYADINDN